MNQKALIAMSGGVDSSVAAYLMKQEGFACIGVTMKLFHNEDVGLSREHTCCSLDDVEDARSVAYALGMPFYVFNFSDRFRETVIAPFISAYEHGETPNPCIECNRCLKFDALFRRAQELGIDYVVTGHYARIDFDRHSGRWRLLRALDAAKDQSYVLYAMTQRQLAHTRFPLGGMSKPEVRAIAEQAGFLNARKHDSQDICFVPSGSYADFIEGCTGRSYPPGDFIDREGRVLGRHRGIIRYTIGQRKGLGLSFDAPHYVCAIDPEANTVTLGVERELYERVVHVGRLNLISLPALTEPMRVKAKVRYRGREAWATAEPEGADGLRLIFDEPQRAVTRGQAAVLYDGDVVVGGGTITGSET